MTIAPDKQMHLMGGALISVVGALFGFPVSGLAFSVFLGYLKEQYDKRHPAAHTYDKYDFYATVAGALSGFGLALLANTL